MDYSSPTGSTLAEVAQKAGVHASTVSRALRNDRRISLAKREEIQALARQMGYVPRPVFAALTGRKAGTARRDHTPVVVVGSTPSEQNFLKKTRYLLEQPAAARGYRIEHWWQPPAKAHPLPVKEWYHRGIAGILISHWSSRADILCEADLSPFSVVQAPRTWVDPGYDIVGVDVFSSITRSFQILRDRGYRQIGFALFRHEPRHPDDIIRHAAAKGCYDEAGWPEIPIFTITSDSRNEEIPNWAKRNGLEAVIGFTGNVPYALTHAGLRIPEDIAYLQLLVVPSNTQNRCGFLECDDTIHAAALDRLDQAIRNGLTGRPRQRQIHLLEQIWHEGASAPRISHR